MYLDKDGNVIKGLTTSGWLAVGVPGTVSGLEYTRQKYGTMTRAALIEPAIKLAEDGFTLDQGDVDKLAAATEDFRKFPATAAIFLNKGQPFVAGQRLVQPDLADTLRLIGKHGADGFYKGKTGSGHRQGQPGRRRDHRRRKTSIATGLANSHRSNAITAATT